MGSESEVVTAVATISATLVSVAAVFVAVKSASAAKTSADVAVKALHRSAVRELVTKCNELIAEESRIQSLVNDLRLEYSVYFSFNGSSNGSRKIMYMDSLEKNLVDASSHTEEAKTLINCQAKLFASSDDDLDLRQGKIEGAKVNLDVIRESISRQLEHTRCQNQLYRENILSKNSG
jgi:hypothetical protein